MRRNNTRNYRVSEDDVSILPPHQRPAPPLTSGVYVTTYDSVVSDSYDTAGEGERRKEVIRERRQL